MTVCSAHDTTRERRERDEAQEVVVVGREGKLGCERKIARGHCFSVSILPMVARSLSRLPLLLAIRCPRLSECESCYCQTFLNLPTEPPDYRKPLLPRVFVRVSRSLLRHRHTGRVFSSVYKLQHNLRAILPDVNVLYRELLQSGNSKTRWILLKTLQMLWIQNRLLQ